MKGWLSSKLVKYQAVSSKEVAMRNRSVKKMLLLFVMILFVALICVWTRVKVIQIGYEITKHKKEVGDLVQEKKTLEADIIRLKSPSRLDRVAGSHFGMRPPSGEELVFVDKE